MTRALLLLTGGRSLPDMLFVKYMIEYWHPNYIFNITTDQGEGDANNLKRFSQKHFSCDIEVLPIVDPFQEEQIKTRCRETFSSKPNAEWLCHFTSAPKVVGIYAHEVAQELNIPYCFLDTEGQQVISFVNKDIEINAKELYNATVEEYMGAYGRVSEIHKGHAYQKKAQTWYTIADLLVQDYRATQALLMGLRKAQNDTPSHPLTPVVSIKAQQLVQKLQEQDFLVVEHQTEDEMHCTIKDSDKCKFLGGDWLEVYVWYQTTQEKFADDCQWGHKIKIDKKLESIIPSNELDVALTYRASLLIAECKTSIDPFDSAYLDKLYAIANLVGKGYVRQVFITNRPRPYGKNKRFESFCRQAEVRHISVITGEELPNIGKHLKQQIGAGGSDLPPKFRSK